jgi:serine/threonine-protein kinase
VLDFGISKALHGGRSSDASQQQMTASAAIMGSPQYMSPEQIRSSKNVDARADVWALGTILHELIAGSPTYIADTVPGLLAMIVADSPPPLSTVRPDAPPEIEAAILRCLQKDRERRFANVAELARAIERFASPETRPLVRRIARVLGESSHDSRNLSSLGSGGLAAGETVAQTHSTWARTGRSSEAAPAHFYARPTVQLGTALGLLGVGLVAWFLLMRGASNGAALTGTVASPTVSSAGAQSIATKPTVVKPTSPSAPHDLTPTSGGVRPVHDLEPPRNAEVAVDERAPLEDDDPRAARNFRDDATAYPAANAKKKDLAVATRKARPKLAATKPVRQPAQGRDPAPADVSPAAPPKKSNTLDLFNDTK